MPVNSSKEDVLVYTLDVEINLLQCSPKYPKNPKTFGEMIRNRRMDLFCYANLNRNTSVASQGYSLLE